MAKPSHRKNHREALAFRRATQKQAVVNARPEGGEPVEVGRGRYQIRYGEEPELQTIHASVDGCPAPVESISLDGHATLTEAPAKGSMVTLNGDYTRMEQRIAAKRDRTAWVDRCTRHVATLNDPELTGAARQAYKSRAFLDLYGGAAFDPRVPQASLPSLAECQDIVKRYWEAFPPQEPPTRDYPGGRRGGMSEQRVDQNFFLQAANLPDRNGDTYSKEALEKAFGPGCVVSEDGSSVYIQGPAEFVGELPKLDPFRAFSMGCAVDPSYNPTIERSLAERLRRLPDAPIPEPHIYMTSQRWEDLQRGLRPAPEPPLVFPVTCEVCHHTANSHEELCTHLWYPAVKTIERVKNALAHLEPAFQFDADGKPCGVEEISICPGPDPNGVKDLPEGVRVVPKPPPQP